MGLNITRIINSDYRASRAAEQFRFMNESTQLYRLTYPIKGGTPLF